MSLEGMFKYSYIIFLNSLIDVVNSPFFDSVTLELPGLPGTFTSAKLHISAPGAASRPYVRSLKVHGRRVDGPIITHTNIVQGGHIKFEMSAEPQPWASGTLAAATPSGELRSGVQAHYHVDL